VGHLPIAGTTDYQYPFVAAYATGYAHAEVASAAANTSFQTFTLEFRQ
jgi:hypothetical protein